MPNGSTKNPGHRRLRLLVLSALAGASAVLLQAGAASADPVVTDTVAVGNNPRQPTVSPDGTRVYVPNELSNSVSVIDTSTNTVSATLTGFAKPKDVALSADGGTAYVTNADTNTVSVVNTTSGAVTTTIPVGVEPEEVALTPDGTRAYVTNQTGSTVSVISTASNAVIATVPGLTSPLGIAITPDGTKAYVANGGGTTVTVINTATNVVTSTVAVGLAPAVVAISPDGTRAYVTNRANNTVSVIDTVTNTVTNTLGQFNALYGVATSPDGKQVYVATFVGGLVQIDAATNNTLSITPIAQGQFVAIHPDGSRAYANQPSPKTISVVALQPSPPSGVTATPNVKSLDVSWTAPTYTGGQAVTSYKATAQPGGANCTSSTTSCKIPGLTPGTPYTVTVTATNSIGTSMASAPSSRVTPTDESHIIIKKETDPATDTTTEFTFNPSWGADFTLKNKGSRDSVLNPGTHAIEEEHLDGWDLTSATCDDGSPISFIQLAAGETVTCTFKNTQRATIMIKKQTFPAGSTQSFQFTPTGWNAREPFNLKDGESFTKEVAPGSGYEVREAVPEGWFLNRINCSATPGSGWGFEQTGVNMDLAPGGKLTCTFQNAQMARITVTKVTEPEGADQEFVFTPTKWNGGEPFTLKDGESRNSGYVMPTWGYAVSETVPFGWEQTSATCTGVDQQPGSIWLVPGEHVTCTFTNTKQTAQLRLQKSVDGGAAEPADWELSAAAPEPFEGKNIDDVPGDNEDWATVYADELYTLSESDGPANYTPAEWDCVSDGEEPQPLAQDGNQVRLDPGEKATCTITNTRDTAQLKLVKDVQGGKAKADDFTLTAKAAAPEDDLNISTPGGSGKFEAVNAGIEYTLGETGPDGYTRSQWQCEGAEVEPELLQTGDTITLDRNDQVTCTITNTRDLGSLTITKEFNPQGSGYTGTFDIAYSCTDGTVGTVKLGAGQSQTITGLPTGTTCTVTEPTLPAAPAGWTFNPPTFAPGNQATVTAKDQTVTVTVVNTVSQVKPAVVKKPCPIDPVLKKGSLKRIKTNTDCALAKPVVLCKAVGSSAAGETAFCKTKVTKRGRVTVNAQGYDAVKVTVVVRAKPKPGFTDRWKPNTWRKSWVLR